MFSGIDWERKLSSRKFWALIGTAVASVMIFRGSGPGEIERVLAMVGSISAVVIYIYSESQVDAASVRATEIYVERDNE